MKGLVCFLSSPSQAGLRDQGISKGVGEREKRSQRPGLAKLEGSKHRGEKIKTEEKEECKKGTSGNRGEYSARVQPG